MYTVADASKPGRPYRRYEDPRGKVWLFPRGATLRRKALDLYVPYRPLGYLFKCLMYFGLAGQNVSLAEADLQALELVLSQTLNEPDIRVAIYQPVDSDKRVLLLMRPAGEVLAYARTASQTASVRDLEHEAHLLSVLRSDAELRRHVPTLLACLEFGGTSILVISALAGVRGPATWGPSHSELLRSLQAVASPTIAFAESRMWHRIQTSREACSSYLSAAWRERYDKASQLLQAANLTLPMPLAHRDFAPWNTRIDNTTLYLFDWETADYEYTPNYDYFHFNFVTSVQITGDCSPAKAAQWLQAPPLTSPAPRRLLLLAYLLDIALQHHCDGARDGFTEGPILHHAGLLLDTLPEWFQD